MEVVDGKILSWEWRWLWKRGRGGLRVGGEGGGCGEEAIDARLLTRGGGRRG